MGPVLCQTDLMDTRFFTLDSYISQDEAFHCTRKALEERPPPFLHRHDYFELFLVEHGATMHLINGRSELLERGALVFIRPDDAHAFQAVAGSECRIINLMFRVETAEFLAARYGAELGSRFFWSTDPVPETHRLIGPRMERAVNSALELQTSRRSLSRVEQYLLYVMTRVVDFSQALPKNAPGWLVTACAAARDPDVFAGGVPAFVKVAGRGHEHVCRTVRRHLGLSPSAYLNRIRMEYAAMRLGATESAVEEIAIECGIENLSHFYKLFREHYGTTPRRYRIRHRTDPVQP